MIRTVQVAWLTVSAVSLCMLVLGGCGSDVTDDGAVEGGGGAGASGSGGQATGGSGTGGSGTGGEDTSCDAPDRTCPDAMPYPGGPCEGSLACDYFDGALDWAFQCLNGKWVGAADCEQIVGGCPVQPPTEACDGPFQGQLEGVEIVVGPAEGAFRPFENAEAVEIVWGGQGSAMIFFRVQMVGDDVPPCAIVTTTISGAPIPTESFKRVTRFRCGESLPSYVMVPFGDCTPMEPVETTVTIDIEGIGSAEVVISVPPEAFCGAFG